MPEHRRSDCESGEPHSLALEGDELRCPCGSLLAKRVGEHLELKCRRCKRTLLVQIISVR
jgi:hypothetical protein